MAFTLYTLIQTSILCTNAIAVLHEERFLSKLGWGHDQGVGGFGDDPGVKAQILNLIRSVRTVMRVPLIIVNSGCIVLLLLFGWRTKARPSAHPSKISVVPPMAEWESDRLQNNWQSEEDLNHHPVQNNWWRRLRHLLMSTENFLFISLTVIVNDDDYHFTLKHKSSYYSLRGWRMSCTVCAISFCENFKKGIWITIAVLYSATFKILSKSCSFIFDAQFKPFQSNICPLYEISGVLPI